jgi:hypothetical protein
MNETKTETRIKSLTWKYFWEQKKEEIKEFFEENYSFFLVPMVCIGAIFQIGWSAGMDWLAIIGLCFIGFWILIGLIALIKITYSWLSDNWKEAKSRAKQEVSSK